MQHDDYQWYEDNSEQLFKDFGPSFLVIRNKSVWGKFDSFIEAAKAARKEFPRNSFIVQECRNPRTAPSIRVGLMCLG